MSKNAARNQIRHFVFRKYANVGAADAIEDKKFLEEAFVDNGELDILSDNNEPKCIVVGRTGSGKTALLERLNIVKEKVIRIAPEGLALTHVSNNDVLNFFIAAGVNMDLFYRLLWRHVFAVEIIREHYQIINEKARDNFLVQIRDRLFNHRSRRDAIDYLLKWGESFWKESEYRVKEVTKTLEQDLGTSISGTLSGSVLGITDAGITLNADMAKKLS
ncbi:MAG: DNA repair protein, partial [Chloroflexi bacterium]|nr:DNA repair protein [Chloroflexota bacterium]